MVWNGLVVPETLAVVLEKEPVISGISCVTFTSACSLFMVISDGVEMMLLLPSLRSACTSAAKFKPLLWMRPTPIVAPVPTVELLIPGTLVDAPGVVGDPTVPPLNAKAAKSTMLVPAPGKLITPAG